MKSKRFCSIRVKITVAVAAILLSSTLAITLSSLWSGNQSIAQAYGETSVMAEIPEYAVEIPDQDATSYQVTIDTPNQIQREFTYTGLVSMVVVTLLGSGATYFYMGSLTKPLRNLDQVIKNIRADNLDAKVEVPCTGDEVETLAISFGQMLEQLGQSFAVQREFASHAAHELKTPLATMRASIQVLRLEEHPTLEEYQQQIEIMETYTNQLAGVVENLLQMACAPEELRRETILFSDLLKQVRVSLEPLAEKKHVEICVETDGGSVYGNPALLMQAIRNLAENAVKYTKGGDEVLLCGHCVGEKAVISVVDHGPGLSEEECEHIFEPYFRGQDARSRRISGNGIGLSLVRQIVMQHGGSVHVSRDARTGTVFTVTIPLLG